MRMQMENTDMKLTQPSKGIVVEGVLTWVGKSTDTDNKILSQIFTTPDGCLITITKEDFEIIEQWFEIED